MSAPERKMWRSLDEFADTPEFHEWLGREFPPLAGEWPDEMSRRRFLKLMGASFALAGLGACTRQPTEKIVPYVKQPEELVPGKPQFFASALTLGGYARGVIVESHEGRPTKIEGNPAHPASLGASDVFMQAAVLDLYDPDRSQTVLEDGAISTWENFLSTMSNELRNQQGSGGAGIRLLTGTVTSPTLNAQIAALLAKFPNARWHQWEPVSRDNIREGARLAFGEVVEPVYHFEKADVIVSLDADFLGIGPAQLRHARDFASRRRVAAGVQNVSRLYVAETALTTTGAMADRRLPAKPSAILQLTEAIATELGIIVQQPGSVYDSAFVSGAAGDLAAHRGASIVVAGDEQPAQVHCLAHRINTALGNIGSTITCSAPAGANPGNQLQSLRELNDEMNSGRVELLVMIHGNPVFDVPADFDFARSLTRVKMRIHLGSHANETAQLCEWHIPAAHELESWSDARAFDGTASIIQPLIEPLYGGKTAHDLLAAMLGNPTAGSYETVREFWQKQNAWPDFEAGWRRALHEGFIPDTTTPPRVVTLKSAEISTAAARPDENGIEISFRADPCVYDGRFANNAWLQELPKPITKLTWDNAALISPKTASQLDLRADDVIELSQNQRTIHAPVFIMPGHADGAVTLHFGYGRTHGGGVANGKGVNAFAFRSSDVLSFAGGVTISKTKDRRPLTSTQRHHNLEGRNLARVATFSEFQKNPQVIRDPATEPRADETLYNPGEFPNKVYAWAMAIDLSTCIGCNACVIACQAENNIPVVGKEEVARGREMHWIRVDTYFDGTPENPRMLLPAGALHALRKCAMRVGLPGCGHGARFTRG